MDSASYDLLCSWSDWLGQYDRAIADLSRALELDLNLANAYVNRGSAYFKIPEFRAIYRKCPGPHDRDLYPCVFEFELALSLDRRHGSPGIVGFRVFFRWRRR